MSMQSVRCHVLDRPVIVVTDLEGTIDRVICPEYGATGECRRKREAARSGPLGRLLERVAEETLASSSTRCDIRM